MKNILILLSLILFSLSSQAEQKNKVTYKKGKKIDFESLLIEGENKKPDMSIVTGNIGEKDLGLLKHRTDFVDFMANYAGEIIK